VEPSAIIRPSAAYRYSLVRAWERAAPRVCFIMLNPSTADGETDDPTIRRCIGFAKRWGFGRLEVVNLLALRATHPGELRTAVSPVGHRNDAHIARAVRRCERIVVAWGEHRYARGSGRADEVMHMLRGAGALWCLGRTRSGGPRHPLYAPRDRGLALFRI